MENRNTDKESRKKAVLDLLANGVPVRYRDLRQVAKADLPIRELVEDGKIVKLSLGLYSLPERDTTWDMLAAVSVRYPSAVICMASAAAYHGLTAENPHEVWAAFPYDGSIPRPSDLCVRGFRWKPGSMKIGVENVDIGGVQVKMTSPERTVVDYLRTMNRTGETELALEALGNFKGKLSSLLKIARELKAERAVMPYVQAAQGLGRRP